MGRRRNFEAVIRRKIAEEQTGEGFSPSGIGIFHVFLPETYSRARLGVAKSHNAPKFSMHFYEHAECLIAVSFLIFPKVSSRSYTLLVFYHLKERQRSPGFESPVFRCLFPQISQKTYPFPPNISVLVLVFQF